MNLFQLIVNVTNGLRPIRPESCHDRSVWDIAQKCFAADPEKRPSMSEVRQAIEFRQQAGLCLQTTSLYQESQAHSSYHTHPLSPIQNERIPIEEDDGYVPDSSDDARGRSMMARVASPLPRPRSRRSVCDSPAPIVQRYKDLPTARSNGQSLRPRSRSRTHPLRGAQNHPDGEAHVPSQMRASDRPRTPPTRSMSARLAEPPRSSCSRPPSRPTLPEITGNYFSLTHQLLSIHNNGTVVPAVPLIPSHLQAHARLSPAAVEGVPYGSRASSILVAHSGADSSRPPSAPSRPCSPLRNFLSR